jgi:DNA-binding NarL/FixJ family response regulator
MTAPAQPLVGRESELALLERLRAEAADGSPRFAQVTGEPGIGKTYLLSEFARRADSDGWLVLNGRSSELERELPFGLVIDAFDAYLASLDPRDFDRIAPDDLSELAGLFPSLRSLVPAPEHPSTPAERFRTHKVVVEIIERLAARQPLLLVLDDLHWADGASIEQAAYVLRRPPQAAVMIVGSFRAGQADPALVKAVEAATREGHVEHLELGPLDASAAEQLVGAEPDRDWLYEQSGGNPFYLLQLARGDGHGRPRSQDDAALVDVPAGVAATIAGELDGLSETARTFADAAAVAGDPFELDLAVATAEIAEADALAALDELIARDLVRSTAVPRSFQFRHPLVRTAIYQGGAPGARLAAHQRAAQLLAARGAPATERAHHVEHAAHHGDAAAVEILREAGTAAAGRAPSSAARWFEVALRVLPEDASDPERAGLLVALAGARSATGHLEDARSALLQAIELQGSGDAPGRVRAISACAGIDQLLGQHSEAQARLEAALLALPGSESKEAAALMIDLAFAAFHRTEYEAMRGWGRRALETARPLADGALTAAAAAISALAGASAGAMAEAEEHRSEAAALVDALPDGALAKRPASLMWLSAAENFLDHYPETEAHCVRGLAVARAAGEGELQPGLRQGLANLLSVTGRVAQAAELLEGTLDAARLTDNPVGLAWALLNRADIAALEGELQTAVDIGTEAVALSSASEVSYVAARARTALGAVLLEAGEPASASDMLLSAGGEEMSMIPAAWRPIWLEALTQSQLALDRVADAKRIATHMEAIAASGTPRGRFLADRAGAAVALAGNKAAAAAERALASATRAAELGARIDAALSRTLAGRALAQAEDSSRAITELEEAAREFDACGVPRYRDRAERELGRLGHRVHRRTRAGKADGAGVETLTGRELDVARLVVDRRTNPEIAAELFLSVKTVETHMRNIFRKLDVNSRVEVARVVEDQAATR